MLTFKHINFIGSSRGVIAFTVEWTEETPITRGWGNGYVAVDSTHPLYGLDYDEEEVLNLNIHGSITFARPMGDYWVFGFDTAHLGDSIDNWPEGRVKAETIRLYEDLKSMKGE